VEAPVLLGLSDIITAIAILTPLLICLTLAIVAKEIFVVLGALG
tara:strand:+ start:190 stop:321 length:132 start_codon:yes stop_codon:yes gene_type:complete